MVHRVRTLAVVFLLLVGAGCAEAPEPGPEAVPPAAEQPAWVDDAVIYELFVPDFTEEGTFRAVIPRLDELQDLGVTTLWLMPIHPIGVENRKGPLGSPYAIRDHYAVNPNYGTEDDFRALVEAVHARGMHLIIDFVANHTAWDHPWTEEHPDWYTPGPEGGLTPPMDPTTKELTDWTDVADLSYESPGLRAEMTNVLRYWVEAFDIDGYRCDVASWVPYDFWESAIDTLRQIKPVLMLAEADDPEMHRVGFDLTYGWPAYGDLKAVWRGAPVSTLVERVQAVEAALPEGGQRLRFITNHDETAWDAPPPRLFGGQEGARAAAVLTYALPGVPLVYNGQEIGVPEPVPFFESTPYVWSQHPETRAFYERFFDLYAASDAFREGSVAFPDPDAEDVLLITRTTDDERLLVAVNVRDQAASVPVPAAFRDATLTDAFTGEAVTAETMDLEPYGYRILRAD